MARAAADGATAVTLRAFAGIARAAHAAERQPHPPRTIRAVGLGCRACFNGGKENATGQPCLQTWELGHAVSPVSPATMSGRTRASAELGARRMGSQPQRRRKRPRGADRDGERGGGPQVASTCVGVSVEWHLDLEAFFS